ncbi:MAG TPA: response regulator [Pyrinomonadaceae bacterium]
MSRRKILLADDSVTIQKVVNLTFADEGIDVVTVGDGNAALESLSADLPDILLADVNMPGPTGYEICERLRQDQATRDLPVILLVGSFEPFDEAEAARVGANAYLTKPFQSIRQLIEQVNELIEASKGSDLAESAGGEPTVSDEPHSDTTAETVPLPAIDNVTLEAGDIADTNEPPGLDGAAPEEEATEKPRYFDDLGYESSTPPIEPTAPQSPDDIEGLYERSLASNEENDLSDIGIDDEIIETSYSAEEANGDLADLGGVRDRADEERLSVNDQHDETGSEGAAGFGSVSGFHQASPEDPSRFENTIAYENWQPVDLRNDVESTSSPLSNAESYGQSNASVEATSETQMPGEESQHVGEETIRMENRFDTASSAQYQFEDVDLLDLSPSEEQPVELTSPVNAIEQGSNRQVVTLSPELIEMIAQRVVEKLSEKY